jgi:aminoglycoside phosphotransferase (APT) family kinase protein
VEAVTGVDESGGEARVYLVDDSVVVKTQRPRRVRPRTSLAKEARLLAYLSEALAGYIPSVVGYDRVETLEGSVEYLVMNRVPGRAARHVSVTGPARTQLLHTLGRLLRRVHTQPADQLTGSGLFPTDDDAGALRHRLQLALADEISSRPGCWQLAVTPEAVALHALEALPSRFDAPIALHSNPGPTHAFVDADNALTGLIDFGGSCLSHPALDLHTWPAPSDRLTLREGYLDGEAPQGDFEAVWTAAMIYADMKAITGPAELAAQASDDMTQRLAQL